ncbi:hypothetical protein PANDA_008322 [Ailuropoda melanoleuca]|uniref:C2H2-type domain-containing protein n=1 Tax=Ailuropoda melanoleuca TaxID=9646 RepID=D2HCJ8_AILME|nr:hypothetical protein PANDA_008322 [Ailuropoda melanoleuca]
MWALKYYKCECCGSDFVSCKALKYHFRQKHFGKVHCEECGHEVLSGRRRSHSESVPERSTMETQKLSWKNLEERNINHVATEISKTCRMCSRHFGTVLSRENHEIQEHRWIASKRGLLSGACLVNDQGNLSPQPSGQATQPYGSHSSLMEGGSYVKGTDTQGCSEIDIVLFSDVFANVNHCKKQLREGLDALRENLKQTSHGDRILMGKRAPLSLRFSFVCTEGLHRHSFEIMAYCDILGPAPSTDLKLHLYRKLYLCNDSDMAQLCALALLPYQVDFVKASVARVKELIRLMIHWFKTSFANSTEENKFRRLPSSYTVELLTIHVWELAGKPLLFSLVQGMRAVLKLLVRYAEIDVVWHRHYHPKFPIFVKVNQKHTSSGLQESLLLKQVLPSSEELNIGIGAKAKWSNSFH